MPAYQKKSACKIQKRPTLRRRCHGRVAADGLPVGICREGRFGDEHGRHRRLGDDGGRDEGGGGCRRGPIPPHLVGLGVPEVRVPASSVHALDPFWKDDVGFFLVREVTGNFLQNIQP